MGTLNADTVNASDRIVVDTLNVSNMDVSGISTSSTVITPDTQTYSMGLSHMAGLKNKIINGEMLIYERRTQDGENVEVDGGQNRYMLDRYKMNVNVAPSLTVIGQQSLIVPSNQFLYSMLIGRFLGSSGTGLSSGQYIYLHQLIEGFIARELIGKTFTLSFWVRATYPGLFGISFANSGEDRSYVSTFTVDNDYEWKKVAFTVDGGLITGGTWNWTNGVGLSVRICYGAGTTYQTSTLNSWQTGNYLTTSSQLNFFGDDINAPFFAIMYITGIQLEIGNKATEFEHRPYPFELSMCQRYFEIFKPNNNIIYTQNGTQAWHYLHFKTKRATPSIRYPLLSPSLNCTFVYGAGSSSSATATSIAEQLLPEGMGVRVGGTVSPAFTAGGAGRVQSHPYIAADAEL